MVLQIKSLLMYHIYPSTYMYIVETQSQVSPQLSSPLPPKSVNAQHETSAEFFLFCYMLMENKLAENYYKLNMWLKMMEI